MARSLGHTPQRTAAEPRLTATTNRLGFRRLIGSLVALATAATLGLSVVPASADVLSGAQGYCEPGQSFPGYEMFNRPTSVAIDTFPVVRLMQLAPSGNSQTYNFVIYLRYWNGAAWVPVDSADTYRTPTYSVTLTDWATTNFSFDGGGFWYGSDDAGSAGKPSIAYLHIPWMGGYYYEAWISMVGYNNLDGKRIYSSWSLVPLRPATSPSWCKF